MLLTLPNEILLGVYQALDSIESATWLGTTNKRLHGLLAANRDSIVQSVLRTQIAAYDDALLAAIAETHHTITPASTREVCIHDLVPLMLRNAAMCKQVYEVYQEQGWIWRTSYMKPVDKELWSRIYYGCLLLACAHDWPALRKTARRRIKHLPGKELEHYSMFLEWWVQHVYDEDIERYHTLKRPEPAEGTIDYCNWRDMPITNRWVFALATVHVYESWEEVRKHGMGPDGFYDDFLEIGYQPDWR